jgi:hypothetical protein
MRLRPFGKSTRRRGDLDAIVVAYSNWRGECAAVRSAYHAWSRAMPGDASLAFAWYRTAVDREERAANVYARLLGRLRHLPEAPARQMADYTSVPGLWF